MRADRGEQCRVPLNVTGVFGQILFVVELGRVDKNGYDAYVIVLHRAAYKRCVPLMQGSHGRYQTDGFPLLLAMLYSLL